MPEVTCPEFQAHGLVQQFEADLVTSGLINHDQLAIAHISQQNLGLDIASVLLRKKFVTEQQLLEFLAHKTGMPYIDLQDYQLNFELIHRLPQHILAQHGVLPLHDNDHSLTVGMINPFDSFAKDDLKSVYKKEIEPAFISRVALQNILKRLFNDEEAIQEPQSDLEIFTESERADLVDTAKSLEQLALGPRIVALVNQIIATAHRERASDIHIEPSRHDVRVRFRVDGMLRERGRYEKDLQLPLISRIKVLGHMDIAEKRIPQDGRVRLLIIGKPIDLRLSTCPTQHGEKVVIRLLSKDQVHTIEDLGFSDRERAVFTDIISHSHGIFLSTGPTGSGKSTTLYAALSRINSPEQNIISIEDPIENEVLGVNQVAVNTKTGLTFASVLRSVLRQDPDVIMLGEIRDSETAQIAVRAAITGHMVLSTLHTNTAAGAIPRLVDLGIEPFLLASALKGVMAQRLVRTICPHCRHPFPIDEATQQALKLTMKTTYRGQGCDKCHHTGYHGRCGIFEIAPISKAGVHLIHNNASERELVECFRKEGVKSILQDGLEKVKQGITTLNEVVRVCQEDNE